MTLKQNPFDDCVEHTGVFLAVDHFQRQKMRERIDLEQIAMELRQWAPIHTQSVSVGDMWRLLQQSLTKRDRVLSYSLHILQ
ncbi:MAG: hypothetical protein AAGD07_25190 [Planctomycetota bacterium]